MGQQQISKTRSNIEWIIYFIIGYAIVAIIMAAPTMFFFGILHQAEPRIPAYGFWDSFWLFFFVISVKNMLVRKHS